VVEILRQAVEAGRQLDTGEVRFRADLARRSGVSPMRITYLLSLLKLAPAIQEFVRSLPPGTPERMVTERSLRQMSAFPHDEQIRQATVNFPGLRAFLHARGPAGFAPTGSPRVRR
jgi:hypothetical protein